MHQFIMIPVYGCYYFRPADWQIINAAGNSYESMVKVCEDLGKVWSNGDNSKAPGCEGCQCCTPIIQGRIEPEVGF